MSDLMQTLEANGYMEIRRFASGELGALHPQLFTVAVVVGLHDTGYRTRYCYEHFNDAQAALQAWNGKGDPPGPWIKQKPEDRLNPEFVRRA
jgi:hypothetical protein